MAADELVADVARQYDNDEGDLERAALARLAWRRARSGQACSSCGETKPVSAFASDPRRPNGLDQRCRSCEAARQRAARKRVNVP